jgi:hypothetical protein
MIRAIVALGWGRRFVFCTQHTMPFCNPDLVDGELPPSRPGLVECKSGHFLQQTTNHSLEGRCSRVWQSLRGTRLSHIVLIEPTLSARLLASDWYAILFPATTPFMFCLRLPISFHLKLLSWLGVKRSRLPCALRASGVRQLCLESRLPPRDDTPLSAGLPGSTPDDPSPLFPQAPSATRLHQM